MRESGVDIASQESTRLTDEMLVQADWVVTVSGQPEEHCPLLPDGHRKLHWTQEDPATARGNDEEILQQLRASRDTIKHHVQALLADFQ